MPTLSFLIEPSEAQLQQLVDLYRQAGWWDAAAADDPDLVARMVTGSHCFVIASVNNEIVGMGRAISDQVSDAYIQDVTVKKSLRDQGLGTGIISMLVERLRKDKIEWIGLVAEPGSRSFYNKLGFKEMRDAVPLFLVNDGF